MKHRIRNRKNDEVEAIWELTAMHDASAVYLAVNCGTDTAVVLSAQKSGRIIFHKRALEFALGAKVDVVES